MFKKRIWPILAVLLIAAAFRLIDLSAVPPGLTHDEADHGLSAWGVVNGERPLYFMVGYGREPLFDYATAGMMSFIGPTSLAGRLTAVYFSLITLAATYNWVRRSFGYRTALMTVAGSAVGFYAVMISRQSLRSITLPAMFALAALFFWQGITSGNKFDKKNLQVANIDLSFLKHVLQKFGPYLASGILLGLTIYTYPPSRVMWLIYPVFVIFLLLFDRELFRRIWRGSVLLLLLAAVVALPLIIFLASNSTAEIRLEELSAPLQAARSGDFEPLIRNSISGLKLLLFQGDHQWRYNISGRPVLGPLLAVLFGGGLVLSVWTIIRGVREKNGTRRASTALFAIFWLILGLSPALVTGSEFSTTRIAGLLPVLYLFPAICMNWALESANLPRKLTLGIILVLFPITGAFTIRDYFFNWADSPEVRVQYESTAVSMVNYLNDYGQGQAALSTTTPERFHSPAVSLLVQHNPKVNIRWFNGQHGLLLPQGEGSTLLFSGFASLNQFLVPYFEATQIAEIPLRSTDRDRPITVYEVDGESNYKQWVSQLNQQLVAPQEINLPVAFQDNLELIGYQLLASDAAPGSIVRLVTAWRAKQASDDAVIFAHIVGQESQPIAQDDRLDIPSNYWEEGDLFLQLHEITLPTDIEPGLYTVTLGVYSRDSLERLAINYQGQFIGDHLQLSAFEVEES